VKGLLLDKIDLKKELQALYNPSAKEVTIIDVPDMNFLMINGEDSPAAPAYMEAIQTLFPLAYSLKFIVKKAKGIDYGVLPLEGLWWVDGMTQFSPERKDEWKWTAMIMQPKYVAHTDFEAALLQVKKKEPARPQQSPLRVFPRGQSRPNHAHRTLLNRSREHPENPRHHKSPRTPVKWQTP
jgi:hypothetical protein